jgi:hypothetical protein
MFIRAQLNKQNMRRRRITEEQITGMLKEDTAMF